ncbi:response regulator [Spirochaetota bacterium]
MVKKENKIRVMVLDDHSIVRDGVKEITNEAENIELIAMASTADEAISILNKEKIDVAIVDITLKGSSSGLDFTKAISERFSDVKVLVMSMHGELVYGQRAMKAGAKGYIMKEVASLHLIKAIETVMSGELYISDELQKSIVNRAIHGTGSDDGLSIESLSDREFEIFQMFGNGYSTREIAEKLNISTNTVDSHRNRIKEKLNFKDTAELTKHAIQWVILNSK